MMSSELHPFAETVVEARRLYGLTQRQVAELAQVAQSSVSDIERGKIGLFHRLGNFQRILAVFGYELMLVPVELTEEQVAAIEKVRGSVT